MNSVPTLSVMIVDDEAPARTRLRDLLADVAAEVPNAVVAEAAARSPRRVASLTLIAPAGLGSGRG